VGNTGTTDGQKLIAVWNSSAATTLPAVRLASQANTTDIATTLSRNSAGGTCA
jgi:hypothetical protein